MGKKIMWMTLLAVLVSPLIYIASVQLGTAASAGSTAAVTGNTLEDRFVENLAFGVGEKLTFDINYGFINAGTAVMEVGKLIDYKGRPAFQITTRAQSNDFFTSVYKVDDKVESIMDATGLFSWRFEKHLQEGGYRSQKMYEFDQENATVNYQGATVDLEPFTQDALSALYFVRTQPLQVGKSVMTNTFIDGKKLNLEVKVHRKERITVDAGTFDCFVVEPMTPSAGIFKNEGKVTVYLTDDFLRMPVLMKSKVLVGSITAELTSYALGEVSTDF